MESESIHVANKKPLTELVLGGNFLLIHLYIEYTISVVSSINFLNFV